MNEIDDILNIDNSMFFDIDSQSFNETGMIKNTYICNYIEKWIKFQ